MVKFSRSVRDGALLEANKYKMSIVRWCFTLNNYTEAEVCVIKDYDFKYLIFGKEIGKKGTPHLQGYFELKVKMRLGGVKTVPGMARAHLEPAGGSSHENDDYCEKDGDYFTKGVRGVASQGARNDLKHMKAAFQEGLGIGQMIDAGIITSGGSIRNAELLAKYSETKRTWKPIVYWLYGQSGAGKSKRAREIMEYHGVDYYCKSGANSKWWDGYDAHKGVIIDDFRDSVWNLVDILAVIDRYEYRVEIKGSMRQLLAKVIVITSIMHPMFSYMHAKGEPVEQIRRRIDFVYEILAARSAPAPDVGGNTSPNMSNCETY